MNLFGKVVKIIAVLLIAISLYSAIAHYRREPFARPARALEHFLVKKHRLPSDNLEMLEFYNKESTPMTVDDVKLINWQVDWDRLIKKDDKLFDENGKRVYIIFPKAIDPFMKREAKSFSIYLYDIYHEVKNKPIDPNAR